MRLLNLLQADPGYREFVVYALKIDVFLRPDRSQLGVFFFFNDTATTEIYTLSLHDALPISTPSCNPSSCAWSRNAPSSGWARSEEHTSELQSRGHLVCRLLLEKKKRVT